MGEATIIGLDIAKSVFQARGADAAGAVVFRKKLSRSRVLAFFEAQPRCVVAMEACASAHHWGRSKTAARHTRPPFGAIAFSSMRQPRIGDQRTVPSWQRLFAAQLLIYWRIPEVLDAGMTENARRTT